jgi:asparagine synthase (glutamine-hydrolysing)
MEHLLDRRRLAADGLFDAALVQKLKDEHISGSQNHSHLLWSLMVFQAWKQRWLDNSVGDGSEPSIQEFKA